MNPMPKYRKDQLVRMAKPMDGGGSVVVEGHLVEDDEGDLFLPHAAYLTNVYVPTYNAEDDGWIIQTLD